MAKLRANHNRGKNPFIGMTLRVFLMLGIIGILFGIAYNSLSELEERKPIDYEHPAEAFFDNYDRAHLIPVGAVEEIIHHKFYSLGYDERHEQPAWVCYVLNKKELRMPNVKRYDRFMVDPQVKTGSADYYDYRGSGYSRGHLAPAGDMAFNNDAMKESFYMSNMSPQRIPFNGGIWRELEESVRDWAYKNERLYIVTGPLLDNISDRIGKNKVSVPTHFYKSILNIEGRPEGIAFIMPNERSDRPIMDYALSIDELEERLGYDLYADLMDDDTEVRVESRFVQSKWPVDVQRYQRRVKSWNHR